MDRPLNAPDWSSVGIAADLVAAWLVARPATYGSGVYKPETAAAVRWCLENEPALFARLVLRALPPGSPDLDTLSSKQSVAGKGTLT